MDAVLTQIQDSHNLKANEWVVSWLRRLVPHAKVLDFASGQGRHALAALALGLQSYAWDQDGSALQALEARSNGQVHTVACDLEAQAWPDAQGKFDAVVVTNYLFRPRLSFLAELLKVGGLLIYQTFALGHETLGRPRRPDFLLKPGELYDMAFAMGYHVLFYEDSVVNEAAGRPSGGVALESLGGQDVSASPIESQRQIMANPSSRVQRIVALKHDHLAASPKALSAWPVNIPG